MQDIQVIAIISKDIGPFKVITTCFMHRYIQFLKEHQVLLKTISATYVAHLKPAIIEYRIYPLKSLKTLPLICCMEYTSACMVIMVSMPGKQCSVQILQRISNF